MEWERWSSDEVARKILNDYRTFAVVGCSGQSYRASNSVARFLMAKEYGVVPVNPNETEVLGLRCYPDLVSAAQDHDIEVVDIFRRSSEVGPHVDEAVEIGARAVWMQLGVIDRAAAERAAAAGLDVVIDRCPAIDHPRFFRSA